VRVIIHQDAAQAILWGTQRLLFAAAAITLAYFAFVIGDAWLFQYVENRRLDALLASRSAPRSSLSLAASRGSAFPSLPAQGLVGRLEIPRLGLSVIVMEGTSTSTLRRAAGHIAGTALPGHAGNVGISAHRDTHFRPLKDIRPDDLITLTTLSGEFRYRVVTTRVVSPSQVEVLHPSPNEILTLVTCYPFYYLGAAPDRFIVTAKRVSNNS
jgi:sortase A